MTALHPHAAAAIAAARLSRQHGTEQAIRFALRQRVPSRLFHLALSLQHEHDMLQDLGLLKEGART